MIGSSRLSFLFRRRIAFELRRLQSIIIERLSHDGRALIDRLVFVLYHFRAQRSLVGPLLAYHQS
jgi:hypothetical protein